MKLVSSWGCSCPSRYPFRFRDLLSFGLLIPGLDPCFDRGFREIGRIRESGPGSEGNHGEVINFLMTNEIFVSLLIFNNIINNTYNILEPRILLEIRNRFSQTFL